MADVKFNIDELIEFEETLRKAGREQFAEALREWLKATGVDFLRVVQDEIIRLEVVDTRLLLNSFQNGHPNTIMKELFDGFGIEAGTRLSYSLYVNDGHKLKNGMWWEGYHYFDNAVVMFEKIFNKALERKLQEWMNTTFKKFIKR